MNEIETKILLGFFELGLLSTQPRTELSDIAAEILGFYDTI